jgi:hypothetical protein
MALFIVSAAASPLFGDFIFEVSVSDVDGKPVSGLGPKNFEVAHLASLNHAGASPRSIAKADEGPDGFYIVQPKPSKTQPQLPAGKYVFAVAVRRLAKRGNPQDNGQTVAVGTMVY